MMNKGQGLESAVHKGSCLSTWAKYMLTRLASPRFAVTQAYSLLAAARRHCTDTFLSLIRSSSACIQLFSLLSARGAIRNM